MRLFVVRKLVECIVYIYRSGEGKGWDLSLKWRRVAYQRLVLHLSIKFFLHFQW